jgi:hypothetical protein
MNSRDYTPAPARGALSAFFFLRDSFRLPFTPNLGGWSASRRDQDRLHRRAVLRRMGLDTGARSVLEAELLGDLNG